VARVMDGEKAQLCLTDPPYGISHPCDYKSRGRGGIASCSDYPDVIGDSEPFDPAPWLALDVPTILWGGNHFASRLPDSGGWLVWDKERPDDLDQATCELAWTNCVKGVRRLKHLWNGCMKASQRGEANHPTEKPVALMAWCMGLKWTEGFNVVFDPYLGSGTTMIACERLNRRCRGIELSPAYVSVCLERYFAETGLTPVRVVEQVT